MLKDLLHDLRMLCRGYIWFRDGESDHGFLRFSSACRSAKAEWEPGDWVDIDALQIHVEFYKNGDTGSMGIELLDWVGLAVGHFDVFPFDPEFEGW
jgi:hypothetical protein